MHAVNTKDLLMFHAQCERNGIGYGLGAKANPLAKQPNQVKKIDCSGYVRWALYHATGSKLIIPDGSQNQRAWFEQKATEGETKKVPYRDAAQYVGTTGQRLFIAFIKPFTNGCGAIGHVWLLTNADGDIQAETLESHGGVGVNSRPWNQGTLLREVFSCYEVPVA